MARPGAPTPGVDAGRLRAAQHVAQYQQRHGPGAGCGRYPALAGTRCRVLRCSQIPPQRPGRRQGADARHHRRLVAYVLDGVEALVMNASGCGVTVKEYGHILRDDPAYAAKAARISALTRDLSELLPECLPRLKPLVRLDASTRRWCFTRPAPCSTARNSKAVWSRRWQRSGSQCGLPATSRTCAAARPVPIRAEPRDLLPAARPQAGPSGADRQRGHHQRQYRVHHPFAKAAPPPLCATGSKSWTRLWRLPTGLESTPLPQAASAASMSFRKAGRRVGRRHSA